MTEFKLTPAQYQKLKNDPIYYEVNVRFNPKHNIWEGHANSQAMRRIKAIVDEPRPKPEQKA